MADVNITIVLKAGGRIEPEGDLKQKVREGRTVQFRPGGDLRAVSVTFQNGSPFDALTPDAPDGRMDKVAGGVVGKAKAFQPAGTNTFKYDCTVTTRDGANVTWPGGGEIEIIRGSAVA